MSFSRPIQWYHSHADLYVFLSDSMYCIQEVLILFCRFKISSHRVKFRKNLPFPLPLNQRWHSEQFADTCLIHCKKRFAIFNYSPPGRVW